ncbi:MAG: peptidase dimerization domain-containing protein [Geminicoccaceae bacterium]
MPIGAVADLQGISRSATLIEGVANHAGTSTPMALRRDAGQVAAQVLAFLRAEVALGTTVATVGCMSFLPNAINVVPARAVFTVDLRDPDAVRAAAAEAKLAKRLDRLAAAEGVAVTVERLARSAPVRFDPGLARAQQMLQREAQRRPARAALHELHGAGHAMPR